MGHNASQASSLSESEAEMAFSSVQCSSGDEDFPGNMSRMFGPGHVDSTIRTAIQACWMALPKERRTADEVEKEIRRITERALANFREDVNAFSPAT